MKKVWGIVLTAALVSIPRVWADASEELIAYAGFSRGLELMDRPSGGTAAQANIEETAFWEQEGKQKKVTLRRYRYSYYSHETKRTYDVVMNGYIRLDDERLSYHLEYTGLGDSIKEMRKEIHLSETASADMVGLFTQAYALEEAIKNGDAVYDFETEAAAVFLCSLNSMEDVMEAEEGGGVIRAGTVSGIRGPNRMDLSFEDRPLGGNRLLNGSVSFDFRDQALTCNGELTVTNARHLSRVEFRDGKIYEPPVTGDTDADEAYSGSIIIDGKEYPFGAIMPEVYSRWNRGR